MREHVVAASKAMRNGDWKKARDYIINDKMNAKVRLPDILYKKLTFANSYLDHRHV
jgi:hypothetical protein